MPQQAAGTRTEPAVSVPNDTSARSTATDTAEPQEDPPGINSFRRLSGLLGVPKYSLMPDGETANSLRLVLPTISTPRCRAPARQAASRRAGGLCLRRYSEPAVVTLPFMSMLSFTASRSLPLFSE